MGLSGYICGIHQGREWEAVSGAKLIGYLHSMSFVAWGQLGIYRVIRK